MLCFYVCLTFLQLFLSFCFIVLGLCICFTYIEGLFCKNKNYFGGWQDGSVVKSADCSSEGPKFKSQQPHGGSQPFVTKFDALFWSD